jgi:ribosomal protein L9
MHDTLTQEQQAAYARYYLILRDAATEADNRVAAVFDAQVEALERQGEVDQSPAAFDQLMAAVAGVLGY